MLMEMLFNKIVYAVGLLFFLSCNGVAKNNIQSIPYAEDVKSSGSAIDFFDEKYFTGYNLAIDESNLSDHPYFSYLDCHKEGYFTVHFIPKETNLQLYWSGAYYKKEDLNTYDFKSDNQKIAALLKNNTSAYNVFAYWVKAEYLQPEDGCTLENVWLKKDAIAEIYLFNEKNKKWASVKTQSSDVPPPYINTEFFIKYFSNLFPENNENRKENKHYDADLEGEWSVNCEDGLTTFRINKEEGVISLYGNTIFINVQVEKLSDDEYTLKFKGIAIQKDWVEPSLKVVESDISKEKVIGKFFLKKDGNIKLQWIGLYNTKTQKTDYSGNDFSLIKESGNKNPVSLKKCS